MCVMDTLTVRTKATNWAASALKACLNATAIIAIAVLDGVALSQSCNAMVILTALTEAMKSTAKVSAALGG